MTIKNSEPLTHLGRACVISCDGLCHKAWGVEGRPTGPFNDEWLADSELGESDNLLPLEFPDNWCVRDCERSVITNAGEIPILPHFSGRVKCPPTFTTEGWASIEEVSLYCPITPLEGGGIKWGCLKFRDTQSLLTLQPFTFEAAYWPLFRHIVLSHFFGLGRITTDDIEGVKKALRSGNRHTKKAAIDATDFLGEGEALPILATLFGRSRVEFKIMAVKKTAGYGSGASLDLLAKFADDSDVDVKKAVLVIAVEIGEEATFIANKLSQDKSVIVRSLAGSYLDRHYGSAVQ